MQATFKAVLYELQPIRASDAVKLWIWTVSSTTNTIASASSLARTVYRDARRVSVKTAGMFFLFLAGLAYSASQGTASTYVVVFILGLIFFYGFEQRKEGDQSAYSVFNKGFRALLGSATAEQLEAEIRHTDPTVAQRQQLDALAAEVANLARDEEERERRDREERERQAHEARAENAANPFRRARGKKARRDNARLADKMERRRLAEQEEHRGGGGGGAEGWSSGDEGGWPEGEDDEGEEGDW